MNVAAAVAISLFKNALRRVNTTRGVVINVDFDI